MKIPALMSCFVLLGATIALPTTAQVGTWRTNSGADAGPLTQLDLPDAMGKRRLVLIAFEYARRCDPIFSFAEFTGSRLGAPKSQSRLSGTKIGVVFNGNFYTWHSVKTVYENGYEAGFGMPNDLVMEMLIKVNSLEYVTPSGERIPLSTNNFDRAFRTAIDQCRSRVK